MESAYMKNLVRKVGKSYKDIYSQKDKYGWLDSDKVIKDLTNKYILMEKIVLRNHNKYNAVNDSEALTIVYHGVKRDFGGKLHLQFDENEPILHLISYDTDVADYNIKTHVLYMGEKYSATTESHLQDFNSLFDFKKTKVQKGTGTLKHDDIIGDYWTGLSVDSLITKDTTELNLVDSLSQVPLFDSLFMDIYTKGTYTYKVFKYQLKQMTQIVLGAFKAYDDGCDQVGLADMLLQGKLTNKVVLKALTKLFKLMDKGTFTNTYIDLTYDVSVNKRWDDKAKVFKTRNLDKSYDTLKEIIKGLLMRNHVFDKKVSA